MIVPPQVKRQFDLIRPELEALGSFVRDIVFGYCARHGYAYVGREKQLESLAEKIETGRYSTWADLDDMFACCIVIPTLAHEDHAVKFLEDSFDQVVVKKRGHNKKHPDSFRFEATRFVARMRMSDTRDSSEARFAIPFEIQIRTAFEHAWSVTTHAIYKSGEVNWKTKRLAAQLKAMVEQMDSLVLAQEESAKVIVEHKWPELETQQQIVRRLNALAERGDIPAVCAPKDWSRFAENLSAMIRASNIAPRGDREPFVMEAVRNFEAEIVAIGPRRVPLSLSLLQFAMGVLTKLKFLTPPLYKFRPFVNPELLELFPETGVFKGEGFRIPEMMLSTTLDTPMPEDPGEPDTAAPATAG